MSHEISYSTNTVFTGNGPYYGLIMAGYPDHFCPRCFGQQDKSNRGKLCQPCSNEIETKKEYVTTVLSKYK